MSVNKHDYRAYEGTTTPRWQRIYVLARYGAGEAWSSKITIGLFTLSQIPFLVFLVGIYLANNPMAQMLIFKGRSAPFNINALYFLNILEFQSWLALILTAWIAPRLITFDLADNALPILLSHPISRFGYVLGKFLALFGSLSLVTWIPGMLLFLYQSYSSSRPWVIANFSMGAGFLAGSILWISLLSILGLAVSSWVKWRVVATGAIFAAVFVPAGIGAIASAILRTPLGSLLNLPVMMSILWQRLLGAPEFVGPRFAVSTSSIAAMLTLACLCFVGMLNARIRAREVVRG